MVKLLLGLTAAAIPFWVLAWLSNKKIVVDVVTAVTNFYSAVESRRKGLKSIVVRFGVDGGAFSHSGRGVGVGLLFLILDFFRWVGWM